MTGLRYARGCFLTRGKLFHTFYDLNMKNTKNELLRAAFQASDTVPGACGSDRFGPQSEASATRGGESSTQSAASEASSGNAPMAPSVSPSGENPPRENPGGQPPRPKPAANWKYRFYYTGRAIESIRLLYPLRDKPLSIARLCRIAKVSPATYERIKKGAPAHSNSCTA